MADYVYMMETRLSPDQQRAALAVQNIAQEAGMNVYLTGGAVRDLITGFTIRDLDFTVQGNALKLQKELETAGAVVRGSDEETRTLALLFPGNVRAEVQMARSERYDKPGKPVLAPATISEDLRRRDFTVNAMALSLNAASRGLLLDPANGSADAEAKLLRILHNYAFLEEPSRLIRATRFAARFHWQMEERTQARYEAAKENDYIGNISHRAIGHEVEQLAYEDDPMPVMKALEKEGWLKVLHARWSAAKADGAGLAQVAKVRQQLSDLGFSLDAAPATMYFLTARMSAHDVGEIQKLIPHKEFVNAWRSLEDDAKGLAKKLAGKEAATPSRTWQLLQHSRPEEILFLDVTARQQAIQQKLRNFLTKWPQVRQKLPLPEMAELLITPDLPAYPKLAEEVFLMLLDGKLHSRTETLKFLKPYAPPPPPPPPPPPAKRGRAAKAEAAAAASAAGAAPAEKGKKGKTAKAGPVAPAQTKPAAAAGKAPAAVAGKPAAAVAGKAPAAVAKPMTLPAKATQKAAPAAKPVPMAKPAPTKTAHAVPAKASHAAPAKAKKPASKPTPKPKPAKKAKPAKRNAKKKH